ncbi:hypothetical protein ABW20_dc0107384 [Dactylellina cionopaga]|nr:hypothetical protein ABW20_dc0107384 [Dactylellina cionopaga]
MNPTHHQSAIPGPEDPDFQLFSSLQYCDELLAQEENTRLCGGQPCPYYMLVYHRDRILQAARNFGWNDAIDALQAPGCLDSIQSMCKVAVDNVERTAKDRDRIAVRLRVLLSKSAIFSVEGNPIPRIHPSRLFPTTLDPQTIFDNDPDIKVWSVHLDTQPTQPTDQTRFKTTARAHYNDARTRAGIENFTDTKEVILWSPEELVMEGSLTNVYFYKSDKGGWITPSTLMDGDDYGNGAGGTAGTVRRWLLEKGMVRVGDIRKDEVKVGEWVWLSNGVRGLNLGRIESI